MNEETKPDPGVLKSEFKKKLISSNAKCINLYGSSPSLYHTIKKTDPGYVELTGWHKGDVNKGDYFDLGWNHNLYRVESIEWRDHKGTFTSPEKKTNTHFTAICWVILPLPVPVLKPE